jgi:hypothetical protein
MPYIQHGNFEFNIIAEAEMGMTLSKVILKKPALK